MSIDYVAATGEQELIMAGLLEKEKKLSEAEKIKRTQAFIASMDQYIFQQPPVTGPATAAGMGIQNWVNTASTNTAPGAFPSGQNYTVEWRYAKNPTSPPPVPKCPDCGSQLKQCERYVVCTGDCVFIREGNLEDLALPF